MKHFPFLVGKADCAIGEEEGKDGCKAEALLRINAKLVAAEVPEEEKREGGKRGALEKDCFCDERLVLKCFLVSGQAKDINLRFGELFLEPFYGGKREYCVS